MDFDRHVDRTSTSSLKWDVYPRRRAAALGGRHGLSVAACRRRGAPGARRPRRLRLHAACPTRSRTRCVEHLQRATAGRRGASGSSCCPASCPVSTLTCAAFSAPGEAVMTVDAGLPAVPRGAARARPAPDHGAGDPRGRALASCRSTRWRRRSRRTPACCSSATRTTRSGVCGTRMRWRRSSTSAAATTSCSARTRSTATSSSTTCRHVPAATLGAEAAGRHGHAHVAEQDLQPAGSQLRLRRHPRPGAAPPLRGRRQRLPAAARLLRPGGGRGGLPRGRPVAGRAARLPARQPRPARGVRARTSCRPCS